jgi:competence protein ComEC
LRRPFVSLTAVLIAGILIGSVEFIASPLVMALLSLSLVIGLVCHSTQRHLFSYIAFLFAIFFIGIIQIKLYLYPPILSNHIVHWISDQKMTAEGVISENPRISQEKTDLVVTVFRVIEKGRYIPASGNVLLSMRGEYPFQYGDFIRFHSRLKIPRNFQNPGGYDYEKHLRFRGILVRGFLNNETSFVLLRRGQGHFLRAKIERFRKKNS